MRSRPRSAAPSAVCGAGVDYFFFDATADGLPFLASGPYFAFFFSSLKKMDPKRKRLEAGRTCRSTQRGEKNRVRPLGPQAAVFYARGAKWTTFFDPTAADGLLFLASGPHSPIFFYTMDPKRKRTEPGPHLGLHSGKKIRGAAAAAPRVHTKESQKKKVNFICVCPTGHRSYYVYKRG